jgi:hypothetical protein
MYSNIIESFDISDTLNVTFTAHDNNIFGNDPDGDGGIAFEVTANETVNKTMSELFTDSTNDDYTLIAGSTAINYGSLNFSRPTDILGNSRVSGADAGAYEYIGGGRRNRFSNSYRSALRGRY